MDKTKINITTIAKEAGVSIATVSRVLRNYPFIKKETKEKVLKIVKINDYEINAIARNLRQNSSSTIGIIVSDILSQFCSIIARSTENTLKKYGYVSILCNNDEDSEKELAHLKVLKSNRVDGIILTPTMGNKDYIIRLINSGMKIILIDRLIDGVECDAVLVDNEKGAYNATKHLIDQGYKKIAIVNALMNITTGTERLKGYLKALKEAYIPKNDKLIKAGGYNEDLGYKTTKELLASTERPDAIFATTLRLTIGVLKAIKETNLRIPEDIGVISFDDSIWSLLIDPPVSAISMPAEEMGITASEMLIKKINSKNNLKSKKSKIVILKTNLIKRSSTNRGVISKLHN